MTPQESSAAGAQTWNVRAFTAVESVVYVGLGLVLAGIAFGLLVVSVVAFVQSVAVRTPRFIALLDGMLLVLLTLELLYTVRVSFQRHVLLPEPFLLVGVISAVRRVLVLTAEFGESPEKSAVAVQSFCMEIVVLTALILALAISLALLRRRGSSADSQPA
jgi:phosphate starvation-inducible membrane PsiE